MRFPHRSYALALGALRGVSPLLARGSSKLARGIRARRGASERFAAWSRGGRRADLPLAWFHAPSVGEGLQARAVLEALAAEFAVEEGSVRGGERSRREGAIQTAYTHFSPSAEGLARRMPVDVADYLPWDTAGEVRRTLDALRPRLLAFTKTEVWPRLARDAAARGTAVVLVAGTLPPNAGRLRPGARTLLSPVFGGLDRVLAISVDDAERFGRLGVAPECILVTGDPAIDSARQRALQADPLSAPLAPFRGIGRPVLVAGSTWGPDEAVLLPAFARARREVEGLLLVIAPHEPSAEHLARLEGEIDGAGLRSARLATVEDEGDPGAADVVLVDRVGVLAHLYTIGHASYVGGGFHRHGLHSVLEPAAAGLPVAFGPRHANARAAGDLLGGGGAREVADAEGLARVLVEWLAPGGTAEGVGAAALDYILEHEGAARRSARALADHLHEPDAPPGAAP